MIAWLGMYDLPALRPMTDRFWAAIRARLPEAPEQLLRVTDPWTLWQSPDLLLAQTCGMPFRTALHEHVQLIGTPDHRLEGCPAGHYRSVLVVRADDTRQTSADFDGARFAYNEPLSQSGWAGPMTHLGRLGIGFGAVLRTGAHLASARAVADKTADMAGIDAVTWALIRAHDPVAGDLRVIDRTDPTPALPYITAAGRDPAPIRAALAQAIDDLAPEDRAALHLHGLVQVPPQAYLAVPTPPGP